MFQQRRPTHYEIALGMFGRLQIGDVDGFESMPGLQKTIDCDDRPNRSYQYGLPEVRQRRSHEDGRLEMGRQWSRPFRASAAGKLVYLGRRSHRI
jgi:hypothetical protein